MKAVIGIDVGTTETKCCALLGEEIVYEGRCLTPILINHNDIKFLDPSQVWNEVVVLLRSAIQKINYVYSFTISIVSQAPSFCAWDNKDYVKGISYLSYYGDPTRNSKAERRSKSYLRLNSLKKTFSENRPINISCLTGYLVYRLTGRVTLDSISAWEIGIESPDDENIFWQPFPNINHPKILQPIYSLPLNCACFSDISEVSGSVIVGTTDSAVLPLSVTPHFQDYYVYLGTWGSLLESAIQNKKSFNKQYWSGLLHNWIISIPEMANRFAENPNIMPRFIKKVALYIPKGKSIAFSGGILRSSRSYILDLIKTYLTENPVVIMPDASTALAAARLGFITDDKEFQS